MTKTAGVDFAFPDNLDHFLPDFLIHITGLSGQALLVDRPNRRRLGPLHCFAIDVTLLFHQGQHVVSRLLAGVRELAGRTIVGISNDPGESGRLDDGEVLGFFPEKSLGRRCDPIIAAPEIDPVDVQFENLLLVAEGLFDAAGQEGLGDLPTHRPVPQFEGVSRELLGDGAGALVDLVGPEVEVEGPQDTPCSRLRHECRNCRPPRR